MKLSPSQLETVRSHPQATKLYLSLFRPRPIFKCRVNGSVSRGDRIIPYGSVSLGSYADVEAGQTLLVGSTDGARDIGKIRVRSVDSGQFVLAENSDIKWQNGQYLTVLKYFEVWAVYPRITHDPNNFESVVFFKDYDIPYTNENSVLGTFINAGSHRAAFRDCTSGLASIYYSATGTFNVLSGTVSGYHWLFEGGTPTGSALETPGTVTYNAPGHYVTRLTVSGSVAGSDTTYRYASIYDYPGCGTGTPPTRWTLNSFEGSRTEGGYTLNVTLHEIIDINEGDAVVIFAEDWYGNTKVSLGTYESIVFSGYVLDDSIKINYRNSTVEFQAGSISSVMKQAEGFSISVESNPHPSTWFQLQDLDVRRAIYHYLRWHTTVLNLTDFQFVGTDRKLQFYDADRGSLYDSIDSLIRSALVGEVVADRGSKLWGEIQAFATPNATGTFNPVMDLSKRDWMGDPRIDENLKNSTSFIEMGGIAYSGSTTGSFSALLANAPGLAPSYRGKVERTQGLALFNQAQLNQLVGDVFANRNARFPTVELEMTGNYRNLDIAPQEAVQIDIAPEDNMRGIRILAPYYASSMQWTFDPKNQLFYPRTTFSVITSGEAGEAIPIPETPPDEGFSNTPSSGFTSPIFPFSSLPQGLKDYRIVEHNSLSPTTNIGHNIDIVFDTGGTLTRNVLLRVTSPGLYICTIQAEYDTSGATQTSATCNARINPFYPTSNGIVIQGGWTVSKTVQEFNVAAEVKTPNRNLGAGSTILALLSAGDQVQFESVGTELQGSGFLTLERVHVSMIKISDV